MAHPYPLKTRYLSEPELLETVAAATLTLYRAVIMSERLNKHGTWLQALDKDLFNPVAGDLVMDVREEWRPALERVGFLHHILRETAVGVVALVQRLDGHFVAWNDVRLVKVYLRPFGTQINPTPDNEQLYTSLMTGAAGAAAAGDIIDRTLDGTPIYFVEGM